MMQESESEETMPFEITENCDALRMNLFWKVMFTTRSVVSLVTAFAKLEILFQLISY